MNKKNTYRRLQDIRRVRRCKGYRALLEGKHLLTEARRCEIDLEVVVVSEDAREEQEVRLGIRGLRCPTMIVTAEVLGKLTDSRSPTGVAAVARLARPSLSTLPVEPGIWLYLDGIQDPGNLGSLARAAEAAGAATLCLAPGSVHPNHPRALRASAGSLLRLPVCRNVQVADLDNHLDDRLWLGLEAHDGIDPFLSSLPSSAVLALGGEGPGLSPAASARVDRRLSIPLAGSVESLNATVAAALVLFEIRRQHPS